MVANVIIIGAVLVVLFLCIRSLVRHRGEDCADCSAGASCSVRRTGVGSCTVAQSMVADVERALDARQDH